MAVGLTTGSIGGGRGVFVVTGFSGARVVGASGLTLSQVKALTAIRTTLMRTSCLLTGLKSWITEAFQKYSA